MPWWLGCAIPALLPHRHPVIGMAIGLGKILDLPIGITTTCFFSNFCTLRSRQLPPFLGSWGEHQVPTSAQEFLWSTAERSGWQGLRCAAADARAAHDSRLELGTNNMELLPQLRVRFWSSCFVVIHDFGKATTVFGLGSKVFEPFRVASGASSAYVRRVCTLTKRYKILHLSAPRSSYGLSPRSASRSASSHGFGALCSNAQEERC